VSDPVAFQEVDDAVRQDELKAWWKRYGTLVVAGAVALIVAVAGFVGWRQYDVTQRAAAGAAYSAALARIGQDNAAARAELERQATSAPEPYRSLAALAAAQLLETPAEQVAALQRVAPKLSPELSDLALVIAGYRAVDGDRPDELMARLEPLAGSDRPFRVSAREVQGLVAARRGDVKRAREIWEELAKERGAPSGVTQRAQALLNLYGPPEAK
jgi:hypothetical protein